MKSLKNFIKDFNEKHFTDDELMEDYSQLSVDNKENKELLLEKYNVSSKKRVDLLNAILKLLRENRRKKTEFNDNDIKFFYRLDIPTQYKKLQQFLNEESAEFIDYLTKTEMDKLKLKKLDKYIGEGLKTKDKPKNVSLADMTAIQRLESLIQYKNEKNK